MDIFRNSRKDFVSEGPSRTGPTPNPFSRGSALDCRQERPVPKASTGRTYGKRAKLNLSFPSEQHAKIEELISTSPDEAHEIISNSIETETTDFSSLLTEYGRSIIKSAIDHSPNEAESLKKNNITAKEKVVVRHKAVENELKIAEREVRTLRTSVFELREVQAASNHAKEMDSVTIQDLKKQHKDQGEDKKKFMDLLEKEIAKREALELELAEFKRDKKRKRESAAAVWEEGENVKLN